jgi:hypothetical protein
LANSGARLGGRGAEAVSSRSPIMYQEKSLPTNGRAGDGANEIAG